MAGRFGQLLANNNNSDGGAGGGGVGGGGLNGRVSAAGGANTLLAKRINMIKQVFPNSRSRPFSRFAGQEN